MRCAATWRESLLSERVACTALVLTHYDTGVSYTRSAEFQFEIDSRTAIPPMTAAHASYVLIENANPLSGLETSATVSAPGDDERDTHPHLV